ncbi:MAG: phage holin family protein, partial [Muribaculaceae bacterium]|nr:phage holin family protein [Muribaculaceae bacterium]
MEAFKGYFSPFQRIAKLYIHSGKLTVTEVLTQILTAVAITFVCLLFVIISLAFVSYGVIEALSQHMASTWAYLIVGGFYLLLIVLMIIFRRTLIIN